MIYFQLFTTFRYKNLKNSDSLRKCADPFERNKIDPYREDPAGDFFIVLDSVLAGGV